MRHTDLLLHDEVLRYPRTFNLASAMKRLPMPDLEEAQVATRIARFLARGNQWPGPGERFARPVRRKSLPPLTQTGATTKKARQ